MHSHIGCICLTFLHCASSNVTSNCLPEMMLNHIGCICLTFLHCVFSNAFSKCLLEMMHNHIGCICLTFLHCVFSNVFSKCLRERMQSHTDCIFLLFSIVCFQVFPQIACLRGCMLTLGALVWLLDLAGHCHLRSFRLKTAFTRIHINILIHSKCKSSEG